MKTKVLLAFSCLIAITTFSQDSSFQLQDYKYRTPGYTALVLSMYVSGALADRVPGDNDTLGYMRLQPFPASFTWDKIVSTDKRQSQWTLSFNSLYGYSYRPDYDFKKINGNAAFEWKFDNRYFRNKDWFWQVANNALVQGGFDNPTTFPINRKSTVSDKLTLGFGKGRIEMVDDAQLALYILKDLETKGLVIHEMDSATIYKFARLLSQINNKPVFASGRKRTYQMKQVDSFLLKNGIVTDARYSNTKDNWLYAYNPARLSGRDWFFRLAPGAQRGRDYTRWGSSHEKDWLTIYRLMAELGVESYRPLDLRRQSISPPHFPSPETASDGRRLATFSETRLKR